MLRVVIDTNLLVSALLTHQGNPAKILDLFQKEQIEIVISRQILEEMKRVLGYPKIQRRHEWTSQEISRFLEELEQLCIVVDPPRREVPILQNDPSDDKYLDCAVVGEVDYVITGDKDLLELGEYKGVRIVRPTQFLELMELA